MLPNTYVGGGDGETGGRLKLWSLRLSSGPKRMQPLAIQKPRTTWNSVVFVVVVVVVVLVKLSWLWLLVQIATIASNGVQREPHEH